MVKVLASIAVDKTNSKTVYSVTETFDSSKVVVIATYNDSTAETLSPELFTVDSSNYNRAVGEYLITVRAKNVALTATFTVLVVKKAERISITTAAAKTSFNISEDFSANGIAITLAYDDGTKKQLAASEYTIDSTAYNKARGGEYPISISLKENAAIKTSYTVTVVKVLASIAVDKTNSKTVYSVIEDFDSSMVVVIATYNDSSTEHLAPTLFTVDSSNYNMAVGEYLITVTSTENVALTATFTVSVENKAASVEITTAATKTSFSVNEDFSAPGIVITLTYDDGTTRQLDASEYTIDSTDYNKARGGEYIIAIRLKIDKTIITSYDVTVIKELVSIRVKTLPSDEFLNFPLGDAFVAGEITVEELFNDGTVSVIESNRYTISCATFNKQVLGAYEVIVALTGTELTCTYNVNVVSLSPPPFIGTYLAEQKTQDGGVVFATAIEFFEDDTFYNLLGDSTSGNYTFIKAAEGDTLDISYGFTAIAEGGDYFITAHYDDTDFPRVAYYHYKTKTHELLFSGNYIRKLSPSQVILSVEFIELPHQNFGGVVLLPDENGIIPQEQFLGLISFGKVYLEKECTTVVTDKTVFTQNATVYIANKVDYSGLPFVGSYYTILGNNYVNAQSSETVKFIDFTFTNDGKFYFLAQGGSATPYTAIDNKDGTYTLYNIMFTSTYTAATKQISVNSMMFNKPITCDKHDSSTYSIVTLVDEFERISKYSVKNGTVLKLFPPFHTSWYTRHLLEGYNNKPITADANFVITDTLSFNAEMAYNTILKNNTTTLSVRIFGLSKDTDVLENYLIKGDTRYPATIEVHAITNSGELLITIKSDLGDMTATLSSSEHMIDKVTITSGDYIGEYK